MLQKKFIFIIISLTKIKGVVKYFMHIVWTKRKLRESKVSRYSMIPTPDVKSPAGALKLSTTRHFISQQGFTIWGINLKGWIQFELDCNQDTAIKENFFFSIQQLNIRRGRKLRIGILNKGFWNSNMVKLILLIKH